MSAVMFDEAAAREADMAAANAGIEMLEAAATHDTRSCVAIVRGYAGLLQRKLGPALDRKDGSYFEAISANGRQVSTMVDAWRAASRTLRRPFTRSQVDMAALLREVVEALEPAEHARVAVEWAGASSLVHADPALMREVWTHLLGNALKFSEGAADASVRASLRVATTPQGTEHHYAVHDAGCGFDASDARRLFQAFETLHEDPQRASAGVGLFVVRQIVERHGGRVWADGRPGAGANFYFALPAF